MQTHAARARLPVRPRSMLAQPGQFLPVRAAVCGLEQRRILHAGVHRLRVRERRLQMPHPLELPRMRRAVVPLVRAGHALVSELVAHRRPRRAAIVTALNDLPKPRIRLRSIEPVGVNGRAFQVVDLPSRKERPADLPVFPRPIGTQHKRALLCAHQHPHAAHLDPPVLASAEPLRSAILPDRQQ